MCAGKPYSIRGFSLLEMAVSVIVLSFLLAGGFAIATRKSNSGNEDITTYRMNVIMHAIEQYVRVNGYLPCPANGANNITANYGYGDVANNAPPANCPDRNFTNTGNNVVAGAVPVGNLGLPLHYMMDGWNRKFTYIIDADLARSNTANNWWDGFRNNESNIYVVDANGISLLSGTVVNNTPNDTPTTDFGMTPAIDGVAVVVISHGVNGHGAWRIRGGAATVNANNEGRFECENMPADISGNTACAPVGLAAPLPTAATGDSVIRLVGKQDRDAASNLPDVFDDIIQFRTKSQLLSRTP